jgi:ankyrin repeat protein
LDEKSQKQILERPVNFQGTNVALSTLVGTKPPESIQALLDSDVISILLSNEHKLSVGRQLGDHCKYYVPRVLQHQIYLKEDILKLRDCAVTFVMSGLQADELKKKLLPGEKIWEFVYDESERSHTFKPVSDFSKTGLRAELENMKAYNEAGQNVKLEEVRYIILGNKNPEIDFRELKKMCRNVHWIHVEKGSFLWRDTNCNIDIIRRYIDKTKHQTYDMKSVVEHNDRTMLLVAEPGMGKSTFLYYMAHEIKKWKPSVWVLRINLNEHTKELDVTDFKKECIEKCKKFLWSAAHSPKQDALKVTKEIFLQALEQTGKIVIILDGFDEISPEYNPKVEMLIKTIRDETSSKIWISSRFSYWQELEDILGKFAFTLQPFTPENQIQFLEKYWSEVVEIPKQENLKNFAKKLLSLCSQNFSDKDGEFTGIPLQTMMLGEAFVKEAKEYCCSLEFNLSEKFNLLDLFQKFWKKKCHIYFSEKNKMEISTLEAKGAERTYLKKHGISSLISLFSLNEVNQLLRDRKQDLDQAEEFLVSGTAQQFGIIRDIMDGKPQFIHRCFAEYFAAKWFTDNFRVCREFISNILFKSRYKVTRNIFDRMLAESSEIHVSVLNNDNQALEKHLKKVTDINTLDKGERTTLHLAASYNSPCIEKLLSSQGTGANKPDAVLKWTPLRYADRMKSWMAMDILLENGANPDDIVFTRQNSNVQEWGHAAFLECASKRYIKLLEFMLNCGILVNASEKEPENLHEKPTLPHGATYYSQVQVGILNDIRAADINIRDANNNTALHLAAESGSLDIIKLLLDKGVSVNLTNRDDSTPLHVSAKFGHLEATKALFERGAAVDSTNKYGDTPLMISAHKGKLETFRYLIEIGADINIHDANKNTAFHFAAASGSVDIINLLLDKGMSVNLTNTNDSTPLHVSAKFGHLEAMKVLVGKGAVINNTNKYGNTPLLLAAYSGILETFRYLTEKGADINIRNAKKNTAIHWASASGSVDIINLLLDKEMSVNLTNTDDTTPLHISAKCGHLNATKALVERGAALNKTNIYGNTPVMVAAYKGKLEIFRYLTEKGADINIRNRNNNTALHLAAESGSVDIINFLLDKGMSVNLTNTDESTPLHVSAEFGHVEATKTLVDRGASVNKVNKYGDTPLTLSTRKDQSEVCRYLKGLGAVIHFRAS